MSNQSLIPSNASLSRRSLGSAAFKTFQDDEPCFEYGDLWLSRTPDGKAVGLHDKSHVLLTCLTRYGKGTTFIIPNLTLWQGSTVVIDPKGENAIVTARRRGHGSCYCGGLGQKVRILDPFNVVEREDDKYLDMKMRFNPIDMINPEDPEAIDIAFIIADSMMVKDQNNAFWIESSRDLVACIILYVAASESIEDKDRNLATVRKLIQAGEAAMTDTLENGYEDDIPTPFEMMFEGMKRVTAFNGHVARSGQQWHQMYIKSDRTFFSVAQTAATNTQFLDSPAIQDVLSTSDFDLREIKLDPKGSNIFLSLPQRYMETHSRWLRVMINLIIVEIERVKGQPRNGHQILMVLDEFAGLKSMPLIVNAAAQMAGFGLKIMFVIQSLAQLKEHYPRGWETLLANCGTRIFFGNEDHFTRDYVSKLIGEHEVIRVARSISSTEGEGKSITYTESDTLTEGLSTTSSISKSSGFSKGGSSSFSGGGSNNWNSNTSTTVTEGFSKNNSKAKGRSTARGENTNHSNTAGENESVHKRRLLNPDEIGRIFSKLGNPLALVLIPGEQPLILKRTAYFEDQQFRAKFDPHPDHPYPKSLARNLTEVHRHMTDQVKSITAQANKFQAKCQATANTARKLQNSAECKVSGLERKIREQAFNHADELHEKIRDTTIVIAILTFIATLLFFLPTAFLGYLIRVDSWFPFWEMVTNFPIFSAYKFAYYLIVGLFWEMVAVLSFAAIAFTGIVIGTVIEYFQYR